MARQGLAGLFIGALIAGACNSTSDGRSGNGATDTSANDETTGEVCTEDACGSPVCEPGAVDGCEGGQVRVCDALGSSWSTRPCPRGQGCVVDQCEPVVPNVLLLVDTSSSMNWTPGGVQPSDCSGASCPSPWLYPACDDPEEPTTRLGKVKRALTEILASESATALSLALQRFPQEIYTALPPDCEGGYWSGNSRVAGDEDFHRLGGPWLAQHLPEIVLVPFARTGRTDPAEIAAWFDFEEVLTETSATCSVNAECDHTPCLDGRCMAFANPELLGMGLTPFGKSLFYAGEYFRNFVLVEGKACTATPDCGSANYQCVDGACHDPLRSCRPNVIIAFTDGEETEHFYTDDFFHPRVQAKRLHFGLGCASNTDCAAGATCSDSLCRPPEGVVDEAELVCDANDIPCSDNSECSGFRCLPAGLDFADAGGEDHLEDANGDLLSLTVHVVDASNVPGANRLVAAYGGGRHFSVDLEDPGALFDSFATLFGDAKASAACGE